MPFLCLLLLVDDLAGEREVTLDLAAGSRAADVIDAAVERWPALAAIAKDCAVAVNERYVARDAPVEDAATVAIIPPVSGG